MMKRILNKDNRGSAIITALVVSTVLMVLCLSLIYVAYSLFLSSTNKSSDLPQRELLNSAAEAISDELLNSTLSNDLLDKTMVDPSYRPKLSDKENDQNAHDFGDYIFDLICYDLNSEVTLPQYYNISTIGGYRVVAEVNWEIPNGVTNIDDIDGTILSIIFDLYKKNGDLLVKTQKKFRLSKSVSTLGGSSTLSGQYKIILKLAKGITYNTPAPSDLFLPNNLNTDNYEDTLYELNSDLENYDWFKVENPSTYDRTNNVIDIKTTKVKDLLNNSNSCEIYAIWKKNKYNSDNPRALYFIAGDDTVGKIAIKYNGNTNSVQDKINEINQYIIDNSDKYGTFSKWVYEVNNQAQSFNGINSVKYDTFIYAVFEESVLEDDGLPVSLWSRPERFYDINETSSLISWHWEKISN